MHLRYVDAIRNVYVQASTIICGVNRPEARILKGENENCRIFVVDDKERYVACVHDVDVTDVSRRLSQLHAVTTLTSKDIEDYQV